MKEKEIKENSSGLYRSPVVVVVSYCIPAVPFFFLILLMARMMAAGKGRMDPFGCVQLTAEMGPADIHRLFACWLVLLVKCIRENGEFLGA